MGDTHWMQIAITQAKEAAERGEVPVGAVLVIDGELIAQAGNRVEELCDPMAHAETLVIREACAKLKTPRLEGASLYVTLEPCPMCATAISFARIENLYYGAHDPKGGGVDHGPRIFELATCHHKPTVYGGMDEKECAQILTTFFLEKRK